MINERRRRGFKIMATKKRFLEQHPGVHSRAFRHSTSCNSSKYRCSNHTMAARSGHLRPEIRPETGASPNRIASSLEPTPRTCPVAPNAPTPSSLIEPESVNVEPRGMAQSPWLPAAAGAAVASSAQSYDGDEAFQNESALASEQSVTASGQAHEQSSQPPEAAPQTTNPFSPLLAAIQKPFSAFSPEQQTQKKEQTVRKPAQATYAGRPTNEDLEETPPKNNALGLEGYCPVALMETGNWVEGQARWGTDIVAGPIYLVASNKADVSLSDPDRYSPALSGDDRSLLLTVGKQVPANVDMASPINKEFISLKARHVQHLQPTHNDTQVEFCLLNSQHEAVIRF